MRALPLQGDFAVKRSPLVCALAALLACDKSSPPSSATGSASQAVPPQPSQSLAAANGPAGADVTFTVDPAKENPKKISIKAGQGFELIFPGNPGVTWKAVGNSRALGVPVDDVRVGARGFRWPSPATKLVNGDVELQFESEGTSKQSVTVIVHVE
jgi:hypothetical protein